MRYVLRLETESGEGIYVSGVAKDICNNLDDQDLAYDLRNRHPDPYSDSLLASNSLGYTNREFPYYNRLFGFSSYTQFRSWFYSDEFLSQAIEMGVVLKLYAVEVRVFSVIEGNTQCVFNSTMAKLVATFSPLDSKEKVQSAIDAHKKEV
jgi:hypothetical protein